jgi:diamine N-acetyltransferase
MIRGERTYLRALEPEDIDFLYQVENNQELWQVGVLQQPISRFTLTEYLKNAHQTLAEAGQMRLMICLNAGEPIGLIDLFDHDAINNRAGIGIALLQNFRGQGLGAEALEVMKNYARNQLKLHQLFCHVQTENIPSVGLFSKCGFKTAGTLQHWLRTTEGYSNVYLMQCIL